MIKIKKYPNREDAIHAWAAVSLSWARSMYYADDMLVIDFYEDSDNGSSPETLVKWKETLKEC